MTLIEAKIILNKRKECDARMKKYRDRCGRCTPCPLRTSLDDYITAKRIANGSFESQLEEFVAGEHTKAILDSVYGKVNRK